MFGALLYFAYQAFHEKYLNRQSQVEELMGVEGLNSFYNSLYQTDLVWWIKEEMDIRTQHNSRKLRDHSFSMMRIANLGFLAYKQKYDKMVEEKGISNIVCYDMLALPRYKELLQYVPVAHREDDPNQQQVTGDETARATVKRTDTASNPYWRSDQLRNYVDVPFFQHY